MWNFAIVKRIDLLEQRFSGRACWTRSVRHEIERVVSDHPYLQQVLDAHWLGEPIELPSGIPTMQKVNLIRRGLLKGTPPDKATDHLGEAESIYLLETTYRYGTFVTDDRPARDFAQRRSLKTLETADVLAECFAAYEVLCPAAYQLIEEMVDRGRGVRLPPSHIEVCP